MGRTYKIRFQGTIQSNGSKNVNRVVEMDEVQARIFTGSQRKEAVDGWIRSNYPGAKNISVVAKNEGSI